MSKKKLDFVRFSKQKCKQVKHLQRGASATSGKGNQILGNFLNKNVNKLRDYREERVLQQAEK